MVDWGGLENRCPFGDRGFESLPLRHLWVVLYMEGSPSGLWRALGKRVGALRLEGSNPSPSAIFQITDRARRGARGSL